MSTIEALIEEIDALDMQSAGINRMSAFKEAKSRVIELIREKTEGYTLVPNEATEGMIKAGAKYVFQNEKLGITEWKKERSQIIVPSMLSAAKGEV